MTTTDVSLPVQRWVVRGRKPKNWPEAKWARLQSRMRDYLPERLRRRYRGETLVLGTVSAHREYDPLTRDWLGGFMIEYAHAAIPGQEGEVYHMTTSGPKTRVRLPLLRPLRAVDVTP